MNASNTSSAGPQDRTVPSPCIAVCRLDDTRTTCLGCGRHVDEIRAWPRMSDAQKRAVWARLRAGFNLTDPSCLTRRAPLNPMS